MFVGFKPKVLSVVERQSCCSVLCFALFGFMGLMGQPVLGSLRFGFSGSRPSLKQNSSACSTTNESEHLTTRQSWYGCPRRVTDETCASQRVHPQPIPRLSARQAVPSSPRLRNAWPTLKRCPRWETVRFVHEKLTTYTANLEDF